MNLARIFPTDQHAIDYIKDCFVLEALYPDHADRCSYLWLVLTLLAHQRNVCAYFWIKSDPNRSDGVDLDRIQQASQSLADQVRRHQRVTPQAERYLYYLKYLAKWASDEDRPIAGTTVEAVEAYLKQSDQSSG